MLFACPATDDFFRSRIDHMIDLRHPLAVLAIASNAGRPRVPLRIMIALLYLKHAFNESDEGVVERWAKKAWKSCWHRPSMWPSNSS